jgi:hypothetical protein
MLKGLDISVSNETESSGLSGPLVSEDGTIFDVSKFNEKVLELFILQVVRKTPDEYFPKLGVNIRNNFFLDHLGVTRAHLSLIDLIWISNLTGVHKLCI